DISAGDLDGDGDIDLVLTGPDGPLVLVNDGSATFEAMPVGLPGSDGQAVVVADLDGDGWLDLVFANDGPNTVVWNLGGLQFEASSLGAGASVDVIAVDLFGDANLELVFANADGDATI